MSIDSNRDRRIRDRMPVGRRVATAEKFDEAEWSLVTTSSDGKSFRLELLMVDPDPSVPDAASYKFVKGTLILDDPLAPSQPFYLLSIIDDPDQPPS